MKLQVGSDLIQNALRPLSNTLTSCVSVMIDTEMANVLWAFSKMCVASPHLTANCLRRLVSMHDEKDCDVRAMTKIIRACAVLNSHYESVGDVVRKFDVGKFDGRNIDASDVVAVCWSLAVVSPSAYQNDNVSGEALKRHFDLLRQFLLLADRNQECWVNISHRTQMYQALLAYYVLCDTSQIVYDENLMRRMAELVKAG